MSNAPLPFTPNHGRQWLLVAEQILTPAQFAQILTPGAGSGVALDLLGLPTNAIVTDGYISVEQAFDFSGTATLSLGDVANETRYATTVNLKAVAITPFTSGIFPFPNINGNNIQGTPVFTGAATVGSVRIVAKYYISGRATETQVT